jgi:hypothetical protein
VDDTGTRPYLSPRIALLMFWICEELIEMAAHVVEGVLDEDSDLMHWRPGGRP